MRICTRWWGAREAAWWSCWWWCWRWACGQCCLCHGAITTQEPNELQAEQIARQTDSVAGNSSGHCAQRTADRGQQHHSKDVNPHVVVAAAVVFGKRLRCATVYESSSNWAYLQTKPKQKPNTHTQTGDKKKSHKERWERRERERERSEQSKRCWYSAKLATKYCCNKRTTKRERRLEMQARWLTTEMPC